MRQIVLVILAALTAMTVSTAASATTLNDIQFIKIAPQDAKAVIKRADGKLTVINPGDSVAEGVTVKEIAGGRVVLEEKTGQGPETVFVRIVNGRSVIERVRKMPEKAQLVAPVVNQ